MPPPSAVRGVLLTLLLRMACVPAFAPSSSIRRTVAISTLFGEKDAAAMMEDAPTTFREGEVLGLRYMQDGQYTEALKAFQLAMSLPGSSSTTTHANNDLSTLDEFEYQAAYYNLACTYSCLGDVWNSVSHLKLAFEYGFDNWDTVRSDPDLMVVRDSQEFQQWMMNEQTRKGGGDGRWKNPPLGGVFGRSTV